RRIILADPMTYFDYSRYNTDFKRKALLAWLPKFGAINGVNYVSVRLTNSGPDATTMFTRQDFGAPERQICKAHLGDYNSVIKITHNNALEFLGNQNVRSKFNLTRTKLHFTLQDQDGNQQP